METSSTRYPSCSPPCERGIHHLIIAHRIVKQMVVYKIVECFFMIEGVLGLGLYCLVNLILIKPAIAAAVQISPQRCLGTGDY